MNRLTRIAALLCFLLIVSPSFGQEIGDHFTAGYTSARTYLNSDSGSLGVPFALDQTLDLNGFSNASSILVFENGGSRRILIGQDTSIQIEYQLFDASSGVAQWNSPIVMTGSEGGMLRFQPAYANDIVILGGGTTTSVKAVHVSTGSQIWSDSSVGSVDGRFPVLTNGLALYHGRSGMRAVDPLMGPGNTFFQLGVTTAVAPISLYGQRAYLLQTPGTLHSIDVGTGIVEWSTSGFQTESPNIIATEKYVFVNDTGSSSIGAYETVNGTLLWSGSSSELSTTPSMALAYDRLYLFKSDNGGGDAAVSAHDPDTGELLWTASEAGAGMDFGTVANNLVIYYHGATERIQVRDAATGQLLWTISAAGVRGLSVADSKLYVLFADSVAVYKKIHEIFFAHIADGGGQATLIALNNSSDADVNATVFFRTVDGGPMTVEIEGLGEVSQADSVVPAGGTTKILTLGTGTPQGGWAHVVADGPVVGSSIFQFTDASGQILNEAGVANSTPSGASRLFIQVELPPSRPLAVDTGFAVVNVAAEATLVRLRLLDDTGAEIVSTQIPLDYEHYFANFVTGVFPDDAVDGFEGTLVIEADVPLVVTTLRTQGGLQLSSYAVSP